MMNKRLVSWLLAIMLVLTAIPALAQSVDQEATEIVIGSTTQLSGNFFTDMWDSNAADMDVRSLLSAYSTVAFSKDGTFEIDSFAMKGLSLTQAEDSTDKTYHFEIKSGLVYNNATPILAGDYVFSVLLQAAPEILELGGMRSNMNQLVGYAEYASGEADIFKGVRLIDDTHFSLTISGEYLPYFYEMMYASVMPYPIEAIAPGYEVVDDGEGAYLRYVGTGEEPILLDVLKETIFNPETGYMYNPKVTSGPYQLVSYDQASHTATLEINSNYQGNYEGRKPTIDRIVYKQVFNDTLMDEVVSGGVDIVNRVTDGKVIQDGVSRIAENAEIQMSSYLRAGYGFMGLSCEYGVTQSQNVRQALAYLTDADSFVEEFLQGYAERVYSCYGLGQWMTASMSESFKEELEHYDLNVDKAIALLEEDGFVLDADGEAYDVEVGGVRYRKTESGELEALSIRWAAPEKNTGCASLMKHTIPYFEQAGFEVLVDEMSFSEMLKYYYRQNDRTYNVFYLATNFKNIFDPYNSFSPEAAYQGTENTSGILDEELTRLADALRRTAPGNSESYTQNWATLLERFNAVLPAIPLYSNMYFDFYGSEIHGYEPTSYNNWATAILYTTYGDAE